MRSKDLYAIYRKQNPNPPLPEWDDLDFGVRLFIDNLNANLQEEVDDLDENMRKAGALVTKLSNTYLKLLKIHGIHETERRLKGKIERSLEDEMDAREALPPE